MGLESGSFPATLVTTNPVGATDPKSQGDDHIRLIKKALVNAFPRITTTVEATPAELNLVVGATEGLATLSISLAAANASISAINTLVAGMPSFSSSVTSSDITGSVRTPVLQTQGGYTAGTFTAATVVVNNKGVITGISTGSAGKIVQIVNTITGVYASGTTVIPYDNTIPQNTEGDQYMSLAITPTSATNKLKIEVVFNGGESGNPANVLTVALFQDTTANALACSTVGSNAGNGYPTSCSFIHYMTSGTTSATTFNVRAGLDTAGTMGFNGIGGQAFGGVMASSITITEISV